MVAMVQLDRHRAVGRGGFAVSGVAWPSLEWVCVKRAGWWMDEKKKVTWQGVVGVGTVQGFLRSCFRGPFPWCSRTVGVCAFHP
jgi:hypothetical protein